MDPGRPRSTRDYTRGLDEQVFVSGIGTGSTGSGTRWLTVAAPVISGETIVFDLMIFDVSDNILDSLVLLDGFEWILPVCGNGTVEVGEQCDDRNTVNGDGCSSTCTLE